METGISSLTPTSIRRLDVQCIIMHELCMTMIDGKVANACDNVR